MGRGDGALRKSFSVTRQSWNTTDLLHNISKSKPMHSSLYRTEKGSDALFPGQILTFLDHLIILVIQYFRSYVPCLLSVGVSSCLRLCYPYISFSVDLCCISQKRSLNDFAHVVVFSPRAVVKTLLFSRNVSIGFMCASFLMSLFLVWSVLPISASSLQLSCFLPLHLSYSGHSISNQQIFGHFSTDLLRLF